MTVKPRSLYFGQNGSGYCQVCKDRYDKQGKPMGPNDRVGADLECVQKRDRRHGSLGAQNNLSPTGCGQPSDLVCTLDPWLQQVDGLQRSWLAANRLVAAGFWLENKLGGFETV